MEKLYGCLLIHGFGGNIKELSPLIAQLEKEGYKVACPSLEGHTGNKEDLKKVKYTDWILSAEKGLKELAGCKHIFIIGFSMGGLVGISLALKHHISGLVTINTPIYYWNFKQIFLNIGNDFSKMHFQISAGTYNQQEPCPYLH